MDPCDVDPWDVDLRIQVKAYKTKYSIEIYLRPGILSQEKWLVLGLHKLIVGLNYMSKYSDELPT